MKIKNLFSLGGLSLIAGSIVFVMSSLMAVAPNQESLYTSPLYLPARALLILSGALLLLGLPAIYLRQSDRVGKLGFLGFVMVFLGEALHWNLLPTFSFIEVMLYQQPGTRALVLDENAFLQQAGPLLNTFYLFSVMLFYIGLLLFGIAVFRGHVFPRWVAVLLIASPIITISVLPSGLASTSLVVSALISIIFIAGFAACGYLLFTNRVLQTSKQPLDVHSRESV